MTRRPRRLESFFFITKRFANDRDSRATAQKTFKTQSKKPKLTVTPSPVPPPMPVPPRPRPRAHRGTPYASSTGAFIAVVDGPSLSLRRGENVNLTFLGTSSLTLNEKITFVSWSDDDTAFAAVTSSDVFVYEIDESAGGVRFVGALKDVGARSARWLRGYEWLARSADDGQSFVLDVRPPTTTTVLTHCNKFYGNDPNRGFAVSRCGRWMAFLTRDAEAVERVDVFSTKPPCKGAVCFPLAPGTDARAIDWGADGEILVFDDGYGVDSVPKLLVFTSDGALRATVRGACPSYAQASTCLIAAANVENAIVWIDTLTWKITRVETHPTKRLASVTTRVYRETKTEDEAASVSYTKLDAYEQKFIALDANGVQSIGIKMALSPCQSMIVTTCASHTESILFVWPTAKTDEDGGPLAIFIQRSPVIAFRWFEDEGVESGARLVFLCENESALYSWYPGSQTPARSALGCEEFKPSRIVGLSSERTNKYLLASPKNGGAFIQHSLL
jgi:hypothetical protein